MMILESHMLTMSNMPTHVPQLMPQQASHKAEEGKPLPQHPRAAVQGCSCCPALPLVPDLGESACDHQQKQHVAAAHRPPRVH